MSPAVAAPGEFVNFAWATANATTFSVTPSIVQDEQTLPLNTTAYSYNTTGLGQTTTFTAVASSGSTMSAPVTATLTIVPVTLSASSTTIMAGQSVTLSYSGPNNNSTSWMLNVSGGNPVLLAPACSANTCTGTYDTGPLGSTTTFSVSIQGPAPTGGQAFSQKVVVTVEQPTTLTFTAQPQNIQKGDAVTLSWTTMNASSVSIDPDLGQVAPPLPVNMGSYCCVHPTETTTYTATAMSIYPGAPPVTATATVTVSKGDLSNLNHIIFMMQENRAFDDYFGQLATYRVNHQPPIQGAKLSDVNDLHTLPPDYQICNAQNQCFGPFHARTECIENLSPSWDETHYDMDLVGNDWLNLTDTSMYKMDRFLDTTLSGGSGDKYDATHSRPLGYYDQTDLPFYYELATQFTTDDNWHSPNPANTVPNRMYLFAATSYGHAFPPTKQDDPAWQQPTIFRALTNAGISWRYYYQDNSVFLANWADWNDPQIQANVRSIQEYYNILADPNADKLLPQVVFIERASSTGLDEHPENNVQKGAAVVANMINALLTSAAWPDSAFILTYDEGGGLFDHVGPILVTPPDDLAPQDLGKNDTQGAIQCQRIPSAGGGDLAVVKAANRDSPADRLHVDPEADRGTLQRAGAHAARCDHTRHGRSAERILRLQRAALVGSAAAADTADERDLQLPAGESSVKGKAGEKSPACVDRKTPRGAPLIPSLGLSGIVAAKTTKVVIHFTSSMPLIRTERMSGAPDTCLAVPRSCPGSNIPSAASPAISAIR